MDVTRLALPGMKPLQRRQAHPTMSPRVSGIGGGDGGVAAPLAVQPEAASNLLTMLGRAASPVKLLGTPDGEILLPTGVQLRKRRFGNLRVTAGEVAQAVRGVQLLPIADQRALARTGIVIEMLPLTQLEMPSGVDPTKPVIGATAVDTRLDGSLHPSMLRIVTRAPTSSTDPHDAIENIVQHEIGHVFAVWAHQDTREAPAEAYDARY